MNLYKCLGANLQRDNVGLISPLPDSFEVIVKISPLCDDFGLAIKIGPLRDNF